MITNEFTLNHVGWITDNPELFEAFWVEVLGFNKVAEYDADEGMIKALFDIDSPVSIRRYAREGMNLDIEIHITSNPKKRASQFFIFGLNHICLEVGTGERAEILDNLPEFVERHVYDNPKGWQNIFLRDFEGNWIELRERM